jgi:GT2 family glycosyltransferase
MRWRIDRRRSISRSARPPSKTGVAYSLCSAQKPMADVSIIIVSWNAKAFLLRCLQSLAKETARCRAEIIVVDNASSDGSAEAVEKVFPQVRLICSNKNSGFAKANNIGIKQSCGRYVALVNSDVKVLPGAIERRLVYMNSHPEIGVLGPKVLNADLTLQLSCRKFPTLWNSLCRSLGVDNIFPSVSFHPHDAVRRVEALSGCFLLARREALEDVGLLDEQFFMYAEDTDWCKRFHNLGWQNVYYPETQIIHYGGASSSNAPVKFYLALQRANMQYWKKHHHRLAQAGFFLISLLHQIIRILHGLVLYFLRPASKQEIKSKIQRSVYCLRFLCRFASPIA